MNPLTVRKARAVLMHLRRNGHALCADRVWLLFTLATLNIGNVSNILSWLNGDTSKHCLILRNTTFLNQESDYILLVIGIREVNRIIPSLGIIK